MSSLQRKDFSDQQILFNVNNAFVIRIHPFLTKGLSEISHFVADRFHDTEYTVHTYLEGVRGATAATGDSAD